MLFTKILDLFEGVRNPRQEPPFLPSEKSKGGAGFGRLRTTIPGLP